MHYLLNNLMAVMLLRDGSLGTEKMGALTYSVFITQKFVVETHFLDAGSAFPLFNGRYRSE